MNKNDLYENLMDSLSEITQEKESDERVQGAWDTLVKSMVNSHIQIIHDEFQALANARSNGEIYHLNALAREAAQRIVAHVTTEHLGDERPPLALPEAVAEAYLSRNHIAIRKCGKCNYQYPQILGDCPICIVDANSY